MRSRISNKLLAALMALIWVTPSFAQEAPAEEGEETPAAAGDPTGTNVVRSGRMEFDARLVKGETAKSGAVYLFKREARNLPPLVPLRRSYRPRIVEPVLGDRPLESPKPMLAPVVFEITEALEEEGAP